VTPPKPPLLDTNIVIHLCRDNDLSRQVDRDFWLTSRVDAPMISVVTLGEALAFARKSNWGAQKLDDLEARLSQLAVVDINSQAVIERYADIDEACHRAGRTMGKNDLWIAACASALDAVLVTADKDFDDVPESMLRLRRYRP
jgi:tRNA(fMet)-specific endonuclease VapC